MTTTKELLQTSMDRVTKSPPRPRSTRGNHRVLCVIATVIVLVLSSQNCRAELLRGYGQIKASGLSSEIIGLGILFEESISGHIYPNPITESYISAAFVLERSESTTTLTIEARQSVVGSTGSRPSVRTPKLVSTTTFEVLKPTQYSIGGAYSFEHSIAGGLFEASLRLKNLSSDTLHIAETWQSTPDMLIGEVEMKPLGQAGSIVDFTGILTPGNVYELFWELKLTNPVRGWAKGELSSPLTLHFHAIPEPSTLALFAIGCAAIGCRRRR